MQEELQAAESGESLGRLGGPTEACPDAGIPGTPMVPNLFSSSQPRSRQRQREEDNGARSLDEDSIQGRTSASLALEEPAVLLADGIEDAVDIRGLMKAPGCGKTVRFQIPLAVTEHNEESLFPDWQPEEWTTSIFEELFSAEDWVDITDDGLLRKKIVQQGLQQWTRPVWGQEVTVKLQGILEDRTVVEKDSKLVFVTGEGDVHQALERCAVSMHPEEISLLLTNSQYAYGRQGRDPDVPAWASLLYEVQLLGFRDKPDPLTLSIPDRIRIGNQKRERGNFCFQREDYSMAARVYYMALDVLTTTSRDWDSALETEMEEEVRGYHIKCLNNLATAQLKMEQFDEALSTSRDVLALDPLNVKALFRMGKLLSDKGELGEALETLKKALKLEPSTKVCLLSISQTSSPVPALKAL
uniref:peptidylprolyl isomerase n=1 Tax=Paramormyrops kingsleyae TaxID=1676925 RepID=A0A3B3QFA2_9TELE